MVAEMVMVECRKHSFIEARTMIAQIKVHEYTW